MTLKTPALLSLALSMAAALTATTAHATSVLIENATLHTVSGGSYAGSLLITDGKIADLKPTAQAGSIAVPVDATRVDAGGAQLYPGLISANSLIGLTEIEAIRASNDFAETGDVNANARAQIAVNADSEQIPVTRNGGVLTVHVVPANPSGLIVGRSAVIALDGWNWEDMTVQADAGLHIVWPATLLPPWLPPAMRADAERTATQRVETLKQSFEQARRYAQAVKANPATQPDLRLAALVPVVEGRERAHVHAEDYASIRAAIDFFREQKLKFTLIGGQDAWRLAADLQADDVQLILSTPHNLPLRRHEGYDVVYRNAARLHEAGLKFAIAGEGSAFGASLEKNLGYVAGAAVGYGLPAEVALRSITLTPAELLGVGDRLGSLEVGKDATVFLASGSPLEITSTVQRIWIRGKEVPVESRHTRFRDRYDAR